MHNWQETLRQRTGFQEFRPGQREALDSLAQGRSVLAIFPTGSGKSLIYQLWALSQPGLVVVVSPLISLMQDQDARARELGIESTFINSSLGREERLRRQELLRQQRFQIVFVTPERFGKEDFRLAIQARKVSLLVVDEAHCVSLWGHDFRPDYAKILDIRKFLGGPSVFACTATATNEVQADLRKSLGLTEIDPTLHTGLDRPSLGIAVEECLSEQEKLDRLKEELADSDSEGGARIVYCTLIATLEKISQSLQKKYPQILIYHGELNPGLRRRQLQQFMEQPNPLMVATPAFGLGIDRANIRRLWHFEMPGSLEAYFQEIGRAGRDGLPAQAKLFLDQEQDVAVQMEFLKWSHPEKSFLMALYRVISTSRAQVEQQGYAYLREQMSFKNRRDHRIEAGVNILARWGCLEPAENPFGWTTVSEPTSEQFDAEQIPERLKQMNMKLLLMLRWAKQTSECRWQGLYHYFGEKRDPCGRCDVCLGETEDRT